QFSCKTGRKTPLQIVFALLRSIFIEADQDPDTDALHRSSQSSAPNEPQMQPKVTSMWPRTDFLELLGITHPIIQAPMSGFATPALAAAVCNAGGLGAIGCAGVPATTVRDHVAALRQATNRPYVLNFFVHAHP